MKEKQMKMTMQSRKNYADGEKDTLHSRARKRVQEEKKTHRKLQEAEEEKKRWLTKEMQRKRKQEEVMKWNRKE